MAMVKDEWLKAAMKDDRIVVELLVKLKQVKSTEKPLQAVIPLRWGLRLPRSKQSTSVSLRCDGKDTDFPARCSPTTPLSWSGGGGAASPSATADGFEETSCRRSSRSPPGVRSKDRLIMMRIEDNEKIGEFLYGAPTNQCMPQQHLMLTRHDLGTINTESASIASATKKSRKKRTFAELKEEEGLLMKESMHLKKELENLNTTYKEQTARNTNLKRIKVDLNSQYGDISFSSLASEDPKESYSQQNNKDYGSGDTHGGDSNRDRSFMLPDLNTMPVEEDLALSGTR